MRLFLSSQDFGDHAATARQLAGDNNKALFIKNAQDSYLPEQRDFSTPEKKKMFEAAGFDFEEIDLRDYFGKSDELRKKLKTAGSFWSSGGNNFVLRRAMKASGLDEILKDVLRKDEILYGGWSAGAMVMSPDLEGPLWSEEDRSDVVPEGYDPEIVTKGLNLVPFYIVPHFGSEIHGESPQELADYYESNGLRYYILKDGQVVVVNGDKEELLK